MYFAKQKFDVKQLKINKFMFHIKQLKMNKFITTEFQKIKQKTVGCANIHAQTNADLHTPGRFK